MRCSFTAKPLDRKRHRFQEVIRHTQRHWVRLTRACNNRCLFCLDQDAQNGSSLGMKAIRADLLKGKRLGARRAILSGGEPTIHPRFLDIVRAAKKIGYDHVQVITNGRMFAYPSFLADAVKAGLNEITFSVHGHKPALHDRLTGVKGSHRQALAGLTAALKTQDLIVSVDVVINKMNVRHLAGILQFYEAMGVKEFDLLQVVPFGGAWKNRKTLFYDPGRCRPFLEKAFALSRDPGVHIWTNRFPPQYLEGFEHLIQDPAKLYDEVGGRWDMFMAFLTTGKIMDCRGERCPHCFLDRFCHDLVLLKTEKTLTAFPLPECLVSQQQRRTREPYRLASCHDIFAFLSFFIANRYFVKSSRCASCQRNEACPGAPCHFIREKGFRALTPLMPERQETARHLPYALLRPLVRCNARCLFCNVPAESYTGGEMSASQVKKEIDRLAASRPKFCLNITGGEPTLRKDLATIIRYARKKGARRIQLQTNGILLSDRKLARRLKDAGLNEAFVGLHASKPEIHDAMVGEIGAFRDCLRGIRNLRDLGVRVILNPVVTKRNYRDISDYMTFVSGELPGISTISLSVVQPRGRAWKNRSTLLPDYQTLDPFIRDALKIAHQKRLRVHNPYCGLPICVGGWEHVLKNNMEYRENKKRRRKGQGTDQEFLGKVKGPSCVACVLNSFCNGVWKEYAQIYGFSGIKPIKSSPGKKQPFPGTRNSHG